MDAGILLPAVTSVLALVFSVALFDQWRVRRSSFQLIWGFGMLFYGIAAGARSAAGIGGWNEGLYRTWYLTGAVWTAGWLGLGTAYLLGRTRFGYSFAFCLFLAGLFTFLRNQPQYAGAGPARAVLPGCGPARAGRGCRDVLPERSLADAGGGCGSRRDHPFGLLDGHDRSAPGFLLDETTAVPVAGLFPPSLRLLTPFMNITGAFALVLGALFSAYVFMPKKRVLPYSLDPNQPGDEFLFNLLIAPVAIVVNLIASVPGALRDLVAGRIHSRVPATILIAQAASSPARATPLVVLGSPGSSNRQVPGGALPVRRLPGVDRGVPGDPHPVHRRPAGRDPARTSRHDADRCRRCGRRSPHRPRAPPLIQPSAPERAAALP